MSPVARISGVLLLPIVMLAVLTFALLLLVWDLLATPLVLLTRQRPEETPPPTRNASIIVLNWNGLDYLRELLPSLRIAVDACPGDHEVIVVDNGSTDGSLDLVRQEHDWVRTVALPENRYFIRGNRAGVEAATRDILVFLNNDMRVERDFLVELLRPFDAGDLFAVTSRIEMAGTRSETGLARCFVRHGELRFVQEPGTAADDGAAVLWAGGGSSAFDRRKHDAIGGFESLFEPCYVEDVSLSWQALRRGWRAVYAHGSVVHHAHRGTSTRVFGREGVERLNWRNYELFFVRSVTDPGLVLRHALCFGWNIRKRARLLQVPTGLGVIAALSTVPRLPAAIWQRTCSRRHYRRSVAAILADARVSDS
ncbi:MAG: glycosyltransferase [bacterium]|nr:glycosyltransferase [bacterium]